MIIKYPPKYSVSGIAKWIKGRSSKLLKDKNLYAKLFVDAGSASQKRDRKKWKGLYRRFSCGLYVGRKKVRKR